MFVSALIGLLLCIDFMLSPPLCSCCMLIVVARLQPSNAACRPRRTSAHFLAEGLGRDGGLSRRTSANRPQIWTWLIEMDKMRVLTGAELSAEVFSLNKRRRSSVAPAVPQLLLNDFELYSDGDVIPHSNGPTVVDVGS